EPEAARVVEDEVVGPDEVVAVARRVQHGHVTRREIDAFDAAAGVVLGQVAVGDREPAHVVRPVAAAVAHVHRAVGADGEPVRAAAVLRHDLLLAVGVHAHDGAAEQLDAQKGAVRHPHRPFREAQPARDLRDLPVHEPERSTCLTARSRPSEMTPMKLRLEPSDEYMHPLESASNFNESMYFNFFDPRDRIGGWVRLGNRANEGYAEMTSCI